MPPPEIKQLSAVTLNLGGEAGSFTLGPRGWRRGDKQAPNVSTAPVPADVSAETQAELTRLKEENNLLHLKVDILVEMLALANLDVDKLEAQVKPQP